MKILFLDLDGTVRKTKSGFHSINDPYDQELIPGVENAIARYKGWEIFGITNQGGVGAGFKTLNDCILEQAETMRLLPWIQSVCFCPDDGKTMYMVKSCTHKVTKDSIGVMLVISANQVPAWFCMFSTLSRKLDLWKKIFLGNSINVFLWAIAQKTNKQQTTQIFHLCGQRSGEMENNHHLHI